MDGESGVFISSIPMSANIENITAHTTNCEAGLLFRSGCSVRPGHLAIVPCVT